MTIADVLREYMTEHDIAPAEMARQCHVSRQYLNGLLNGSTQLIRLDKALNIADAMGVSVDELARRLYGGAVESQDAEVAE